MIHRHLALVVAFLLGACTNYDFARARTASGDYDISKLITDLAASGEDHLVQGSWIPLVHMDVTSFKKSDPWYPEGYTLEHLAAIGPVFCFGGMDQTLFDAQGKRIENDAKGWLVWGALWHDNKEFVETTSGRRLGHSYRYLLIGGDDSVLYSRPAEQARGN